MVQMIMPTTATQRKTRAPQHPFFIRSRPFQIQPMFIAPVLPGETLDRLLLQSRVVTDPIQNRLIGWWAEYHFFYVKIRDLAGRDDFTQMFLELGYDLSAYNSAQNFKTYHFGSTIDWCKLCLDRVVEEFFVNEGETAPTLDGVPLAQIVSDRWLDSVIPYADRTSVDIDLTDAGSQDGTAVTASEIDTAMRTWSMLQMQGMTNATFEDYCAAAGVKMAPADEPHRPEWIRSVRDWTYPTNTVEPTTGTPSSACSWSIRETADKKRFFKEPGFLLGVQVVRPKVYLRNLEGSALGLMTSMLPWLPAVLQNDPRTSQINVAQGAGPFSIGSDSDGYWVDMADLFHHGDQFLNFDPAAVADANLVDLPTAALLKRYADSDDVNALFVGSTAATRKIEADGIVSLAVKTQLPADMTPSQSHGAQFVANG